MNIQYDSENEVSAIETSVQRIRRLIYLVWLFIFAVTSFLLVFLLFSDASRLTFDIDNDDLLQAYVTFTQLFLSFLYRLFYRTTNTDSIRVYNRRSIVWMFMSSSMFITILNLSVVVYKLTKNGW